MIVWSRVDLPPHRPSPSTSALRWTTKSETEALDQPRQADPPGPPPRGSQGADDAGFQGLGPSAHTRTRWPALVWTAGRLDGALGAPRGLGRAPPTATIHPSLHCAVQPSVGWIGSMDGIQAINAGDLRRAIDGPAPPPALASAATTDLLLVLQRPRARMQRKHVAASSRFVSFFPHLSISGRRRKHHAHAAHSTYALPTLPSASPA